MSDVPPALSVCDYCKLPLPRSWWASEPVRASRDAEYCCFGCRFAAAVTQERGEKGAARWMLTRLGLAIFFTMNVMVFAMALWSQDLYPEAAADAAPMASSLAGVFRYLCLLFSVPVLLLLAPPIADNALRGLRRGLPAADLLILFGAAAAYGYSFISVIRGAGHVYFEVGCMVLVVATLGQWLEATGKLRTSEALDTLSALLPAEARVTREGNLATVALGELRAGDIVHASPGERLAADGELLADAAAFDEQILTGESEPVTRHRGDLVFAGMLNLDAEATIRVRSEPGQTTLDRLIAAVRAAQQTPGRYQRIADRVAMVFVPTVAAIAIATFGYHAAHGRLEAGLTASLAVVLIACPCSLGLATPMAVSVALGLASRRQVVFRSGETLERLAAVRTIFFDKTGTLTTGQPQVARLVHGPGVDREKLLARAATLAAGSAHSFSAAVRAYAGSPPRDGTNLELRTEPGRGITASDLHTGEGMFLGSPALAEALGCRLDGAVRAAVEAALAAGESFSLVGWQRAVRGVFVFRERVRSEAAGVLAQLASDGFQVSILTGDHARRADVLRRTLGVSVAAELLPDDKVAAVRRAQRKRGLVAMVGDGINDAPALATSDVGIAMGCGADLARESAEVCLMAGDLERLAWSIQLARRTVRIIRQNLFWAFAYNGVGIVLAGAGWLNPIFAAVAMAASSFLVVGNSLRLRQEEVGEPTDLATTQSLSDVAIAAIEDVSKSTPRKETAASGSTATLSQGATS